MRNTLHLGCCLWRRSGCARCVFLLLSLVLDERFEASALCLQIWRILWLKTKKMTSLCSTCTGVSANSVVSAVAGLSCVLSAPVGHFRRREEICAICLGRIFKIKAKGIFCKFDQRFVYHCRIWPSFSGPFVLSPCFGLWDDCFQRAASHR